MIASHLQICQGLKLQKEDSIKSSRQIDTHYTQCLRRDIVEVGGMIGGGVLSDGGRWRVAVAVQVEGMGMRGK